MWQLDPEYAQARPQTEFAFADVSAEVERGSRLADLEPQPSGPARVASYTVIYDGMEPASAVLVCDLPDGRRTLVRSLDRGFAERATREEICGRAVELSAGEPQLI